MIIDKLQYLNAIPTMLGQAAIRPVLDSSSDDGTIPATLRTWLLQMRLLQAIPFAYLVADSALLPEESIRWFYVDRRWTDAAVQGALSVGTVNSDDRVHLTAQYDAIRDELDTEERNQRSLADDPHLTGDGGPISGFLLRSKAVSGWPALHVRAYDTDPTQDDTETPPTSTEMRLLRLERLAPAVLLCVFDGIPKVVHIEEPRQGIQFGFDDSGTPTQFKATLKPRNEATFGDLATAPIQVNFRRGGSGVVNIKRLQADLKPLVHPNPADPPLDSAQYALQLVRKPYRQVWGDPEEPVVAKVFTATIAYKTMVSKVFMKVQP
jgi:hypothetical protein